MTTVRSRRMIRYQLDDHSMRDGHRVKCDTDDYRTRWTIYNSMMDVQ